MRIPLYLPKWAIISLLVVVGAVLGWKMHNSSPSRTDPLVSDLFPGDSWAQSSPSQTPGIEDPSGASPSGAGAAGGVHISAMPTADGTWRVVSNGSSGVPVGSDSGWNAVYTSAYHRSVPANGSTSPAPGSGTPPSGAYANGNPDPAPRPRPLTIPPFFGQAVFTPLPGAKSRAVAFSEWESYRTDVAGDNILVTTDDSNFFRDRTGKINANTGDTDASGLNITDAEDSVILGTTSADAPIPEDGQSGEPPDPSEPGDAPDADTGDRVMTAMQARPLTASDPVALAAVVAPQSCDGDAGDCGDDSTPPDSTPSDPASSGDSDFPYLAWVQNANSNAATSIHTDEGTTLASGADAVVIGGDGYDDDDNRAAGSNIVITRDDGNVVVGGKGDVNAQIGDSEQGAVIMNVKRVYIKGGGAF